MGIIEPLAMGGVIMDAGIHFASAVVLWSACATMLTALTGILLSGRIDAAHGA